MLARLWQWKYYLLALLVANGLLYFFFDRDLSSKQQVYLDQSVKALQSQYKATSNAYDLLSRFEFSLLADDKILLGILNEATKSDATDKEALRRKLILHLKSMYQRLKQYHFSRFYFTFTNGSVFARLHKTYAYGDKPANTKLNLALQKVVPPTPPVATFSEFTYSEPLYFQGVRVGYANLSVAFDLFRSELTRLFPSYYQVVYSGSNVLETLSGEARKRFVQSDLNSAYYTDADTHISNSLQAFLSSIHRCIREEASIRMQEGKPFGIACQLETQWIAVSFLPLSRYADSNGKAGYLISYTPDPVLESFTSAFYVRMLLGNLMLLIILGFIYFLERHARQFKMLATHDTLTGIFNRREFDRIVEEEFERSSRYDRPMSIILMDIDHFKQVNDTYGHQEGDLVLKGLAQFIQGHIRRHDFFARWGGEEFAILATETTAAEAAQLAEKLRIHLQQQRFGTVGQITVSFGVAQNSENIENFAILFKQVDEALYRAKEAGRNRVEIYGESL